MAISLQNTTGQDTNHVRSKAQVSLSCFGAGKGNETEQKKPTTRISGYIHPSDSFLA